MEEMKATRDFMLGFVQTVKWWEICAAVGSYFLFSYWSQRKRRGPFCWPLVGMLPSLLININRLYDWITELLQESGGTFVFRGPWMSKMQSVMTCDPGNIEYALRTNFANYPKGIDFQNLFRDLLGEGIFNVDSESWRLQRKIASLEFNSRSFREFVANRVQEMVENRLVPLLGDAADRGAAIDLQDVFLRYTFDNTCSLVFGRNPACLAVDLPEIPFANYPKGIDFQNLFLDLLGEGIFNADSESWRLQRKIASLEFNSRSFREFVANRVQEMVEKRLVPLLGDAADRGAAIDLQDVFLRYTFDNTCSLVFGRNPGCLAVDLPEIPFAKAFDDAVEATLYRHVMPRTLWKLFRLLKIGKERQFQRALKPLNEFVDDLIDYKKSVIAKTGESMSEPMSKDLLTSFICKLSDGNATISYSDKFLRDSVMNFVLAGRDTSGVALTWFFWLLSDNPRVEENIVKEISYILLKRRTYSESHEGYLDMEKTLTEKELQECVYLQAALSETLRLYPSVPLDHKGVVKEDVLPDGTCIKPGMRFLYSIYSLGRMESIWGPDCLEFKPERWIGMSSDGQAMINHESAYKFAAFNGGPRVCLGKNMAYMQMKAAAAGILRRFQVRVVENHLVVPKISLILTMKHGLRVILTRRPPTLPLNSKMSTGFA